MSLFSIYDPNRFKAAEPEFLPSGMIFTKSYPGKNGTEKITSGFRFHSCIYDLATVFQDVGGETFGNKGRRRVLKIRRGGKSSARMDAKNFFPVEG